MIRYVSLLEGISVLVLFFIAMPLKYIWDMPVWVKHSGMIHGILFIAFMMMIFRSMLEYKWGLKYSFQLFLSSLVPFGFLWADKTLKQKISS